MLIKNSILFHLSMTENICLKRNEVNKCRFRVFNFYPSRVLIFVSLKRKQWIWNDKNEFEMKKKRIWNDKNEFEMNKNEFEMLKRTFLKMFSSKVWWCTCRFEKRDFC
jgi:hypothetical protein